MLLPTPDFHPVLVDAETQRVREMLSFLVEMLNDVAGRHVQDYFRDLRQTERRILKDWEQSELAKRWRSRYWWRCTWIEAKRRVGNAICCLRGGTCGCEYDDEDDDD